jgi:hypothetical protein
MFQSLKWNDRRAYNGAAHDLQGPGEWLAGGLALGSTHPTATHGWTPQVRAACARVPPAKRHTGTHAQGEPDHGR